MHIMKNQNERGVIQKMALGSLMSTPFQKLIVAPIIVQLQEEAGNHNCLQYFELNFKQSNIN